MAAGAIASASGSTSPCRVSNGKVITSHHGMAEMQDNGARGLVEVIN